MRKYSVRSDLPDLRDKFYEPTLRRLAIEKHPKWLTASGSDGNKTLRIPLRDQGDEGSCIAQALASLIDILKLENEGNDSIEGVSARMLFKLATEQQLTATGSSEFHMLRPGIKTFYHNGVCTRKLWPDDDVGGELNVLRAKDARKTSLGAYYRLHPLLNDYHAALNEANAIIVASMIHSGWDPAIVSNNNGHIDESRAAEQGGHAFVIVGYDAAGFFVFNSWGAEWGRYDGLPGIAHWCYEDWADNIMDAYVLRLGVPTPEAFQFSHSEQGFGSSISAIKHAAARRFEVVGHYAHFDDGQHVQTGNYPSSRTDVNETLSYLKRATTREPPQKGKKAMPRPTRVYRDVLLRIAGGTEDTDLAMHQIASSKQYWKDANIYPYSLVWCSDFIAQATPVLANLLRRTWRKVGTAGPAYDRACEVAVRDIGRALWRNVKYFAHRTSARSGDVSKLLNRFVALCHDTCHYRLHLVAEGAGAVLLLNLLDAMNKRQTKRLIDAVSTLSLVTPACRIDDYQVRGADFVGALQGRGDWSRRAVLYRADPAFEAQLRVGRYSKSILHLISAAFEDWIQPIQESRSGRAAQGTTPAPKPYPPLLLGMGRSMGLGTESADRQQTKIASSDIAAQPDRKDRLPDVGTSNGLEVREIPSPEGRPGPYDLLHVIHHPDIRKDICERILACPDQMGNL